MEIGTILNRLKKADTDLGHELANWVIECMLDNQRNMRDTHGQRVMYLRDGNPFFDLLVVRLDESDEEVALPAPLLTDVARRMLLERVDVEIGYTEAPDDDEIEPQEEQAVVTEGEISDAISAFTCYFATGRRSDNEGYDVTHHDRHLAESEYEPRFVKPLVEDADGPRTVGEICERIRDLAEELRLKQR